MDLFEFLSELFLDYGYVAVFTVLLLCGLGLPLPEEVTLVGAGLVVYEGRAELLPMMAVTVVGILVGDCLLLFLGRRFGPALLRKRFFARILHAERMSKVQRQFDKHGQKAVFFARFFAGIRGCVYFTAGTLGMRYRTFILLDLAGALLSAPISVWLGFHFGEQIEGAWEFLTRFEHGLFAVVLAVIAWYLIRWAIRSARATRASRVAAAAVHERAREPRPVGHDAVDA